VACLPACVRACEPPEGVGVLFWFGSGPSAAVEWRMKKPWRRFGFFDSWAIEARTRRGGHLHLFAPRASAVAFAGNNLGAWRCALLDEGCEVRQEFVQCTRSILGDGLEGAMAIVRVHLHRRSDGLASLSRARFNAMPPRAEAPVGSPRPRTD